MKALSNTPKDSGTTTRSEFYIIQANPLIIFFNICYYLGYVPFRVKWDQKRHIFITISYVPQKVYI